MDYKDWDREDQEYQLLARELQSRYPQLKEIANTNLQLAPVLDNPDVDLLAKATLWYSKVKLDNFLREENEKN